MVNLIIYISHDNPWYLIDQQEFRNETPSSHFGRLTATVLLVSSLSKWIYDDARNITATRWIWISCIYLGYHKSNLWWKSLRSAFCDHIYFGHPSPKKIRNTSGESSPAEDHLEDQVAGHQPSSTNMLWGRSVLRFEMDLLPTITNRSQPLPQI